MSMSVAAFILCHKNCQFLPLSASSLCMQTRRPDQWAVLKTDCVRETDDQARRIAADRGIPFICTDRPLTCAASKNYAAGLVATDTFFILDADDILDAEFVRACAWRLERNESDVCGCTYLQRANGVTMGADIVPVSHVKRGNPLPSCSLIRKSAYDRSGGFREVYYDDWAMWLTLAKLGFKLDRVEQRLMVYVRHAGALTQPERDAFSRQQLVDLGLLEPRI